MKISKFLVIKILLFFLAICFGNLFLYLFVSNLSGGHLLTNSPFQIILSFIYPIIFFALFICLILYFSFFAKHKYIWLLCCVLSFVSYPFLIKFSILNLAGGGMIAASVYFFLISFHNFRIIFRDRPSLVGQLSMSLTATTLVISVVIAFNFYSFYKTILSENNIIFSDKLILNSLSPILKIYLDDLSLSNVNITFGQYITQQAAITKKLPSEIKSATISKLSISSADENQPMKDLIRTSLNNSVFKIISNYRRQLPLVLSLGLGIITQTMMTVSTLLAGIFVFLLLKIFRKINLIGLKKTQLEGQLPFSLE